jgi:hypothetical protein
VRVSRPRTRTRQTAWLFFLQVPPIGTCSEIFKTQKSECLSLKGGREQGLEKLRIKAGGRKPEVEGGVDTSQERKVGQVTGACVRKRKRKE